MRPVVLRASKLPSGQYAHAIDASVMMEVMKARPAWAERPILLLHLNAGETLRPLCGREPSERSSADEDPQCALLLNHNLPH